MFIKRWNDRVTSIVLFSFNAAATTEIYTLSLHDALPIYWFDGDGAVLAVHFADGQAQAVYRYVHSAG